MLLYVNIKIFLNSFYILLLIKKCRVEHPRDVVVVAAGILFIKINKFYLKINQLEIFYYLRKLEIFYLYLLRVT